MRVFSVTMLFLCVLLWVSTGPATSLSAPSGCELIDGAGFWNNGYRYVDWEHPQTVKDSPTNVKVQHCKFPGPYAIDCDDGPTRRVSVGYSVSCTRSISTTHTGKFSGGITIGIDLKGVLAGLEAGGNLDWEKTSSTTKSYSVEATYTNEVETSGTVKEKALAVIVTREKSYDTRNHLYYPIMKDIGGFKFKPAGRCHHRSWAVSVKYKIVESGEGKHKDCCWNPMKPKYKNDPDYQTTCWDY